MWWRCFTVGIWYGSFVYIFIRDIYVPYTVLLVPVSLKYHCIFITYNSLLLIISNNHRHIAVQGRLRIRSLDQVVLKLPSHVWIIVEDLVIPLDVWLVFVCYLEVWLVLLVFQSADSETLNPFPSNKVQKLRCPFSCDVFFCRCWVIFNLIFFLNLNFRLRSLNPRFF